MLLVSAKTGYGLDSLLAKIDEILAHRVRTIEVLLPYDKLALADVFRTRGSVLAEEYRENGVYYRATVRWMTCTGLKRTCCKRSCSLCAR